MYNDFSQWCKIKIPYVFVNFEDAIIQWYWMEEEKCGRELKWGGVQEREQEMRRTEKERQWETDSISYWHLDWDLVMFSTEYLPDFR